MRNRLPWKKMHLDLDLGKRHLAVFLGSVAALIVLALTPQLLGDLVAEGIDGLSDASAGWLWIAAAAFGASLRDLRVRLAVRARPAAAARRRAADSSARYCTGSIVNALAPARLGTAVRFALFSRTLHERRPALDGRRDRRLASSAVRAMWLALVLALGVAERRAPALADRGAAARGSSSRRSSPGARARLASRHEVRPRPRRLPRPRPLPTRRRADRRLGRALDGAPRRRRDRRSPPHSESTIRSPPRS